MGRKPSPFIMKILISLVLSLAALTSGASIPEVSEAKRLVRQIPRSDSDLNSDDIPQESQQEFVGSQPPPFTEVPEVLLTRPSYQPSSPGPPGPPGPPGQPAPPAESSSPSAKSCLPCALFANGEPEKLSPEKARLIEQIANVKNGSDADTAAIRRVLTNLNCNIHTALKSWTFIWNLIGSIVPQIPPANCHPKSHSARSESLPAVSSADNAKAPREPADSEPATISMQQPEDELPLSSSLEPQAPTFQEADVKNNMEKEVAYSTSDELEREMGNEEKSSEDDDYDDETTEEGDDDGEASEEDDPEEVEKNKKQGASGGDQSVGRKEDQLQQDVMPSSHSHHELHRHHQGHHFVNDQDSPNELKDCNCVVDRLTKMKKALRAFDSNACPQVRR